MKLCCIVIAVLLLGSCAGIQEASEEPQPAATADVPESQTPATDRSEIGSQPAEETQVPAAPEASEAPVVAAADSERDDTTAPEESEPAEDPEERPLSEVTAPGAATITATITAADEASPSEPDYDPEEDIAADRAVAPEPLPPPLPDPLDSRQINGLVFSQIGEGLIPVHRSGSALYLLHDIDSNGYNDVFALAVRTDLREDAELANISDYTRLFRAQDSAMEFYLRLFYQRKGSLFPADLVPLGERTVVDSFRPQAIVEGENIPFAVSIVFTTLQGRVWEWAIFSGEKPGRFTIQERSGELLRVEDINEDGAIDVVIYEEIYEAGIGNETYLTWYEWDGTGFSSRANVNVVRNLRRFLHVAFDAIREGNWSEFAEHALSKETRAAAQDLEYSSFDIFRRVFTLAAVEEAFRNQPITEDDTIRRAVYPEIRENPFSQRDSVGFFFPLSIRFETSAGRNHLYTTRIYMLPNPFGERQFTFSIEDI